METHDIAGVVLFKRNIKSLRQVYELCSKIKLLNKKDRCLIAVDVEGGDVNRFSHIQDKNFILPSPRVFCKWSKKKIFSHSKAIGNILRCVGVDINFAPVVDLLCVESQLLKNRVLGKTKKQIITHATAFMKGLIQEGITPCLKHFPSHGGVKTDSHVMLPVDCRNLSALNTQLQIFQCLFQEIPNCWIMTSHVQFPGIEKTPSSFSKILLKNVLRDKMGFRGVIVSDDIAMEALTGFSMGERFFHAIKGGCDMVINCRPGKSKEILTYLNKNSNKQALVNELKTSKKTLTVFKKYKKQNLI